MLARPASAAVVTRGVVHHLLESTILPARHEAPLVRRDLAVTNTRNVQSEWPQQWHVTGEGPLGLHPERSVLYAQVMDGNPRMKIDGEGYLRQANWPGDGKEVYLGDVAKASLRSLGPHDPPKFSVRPGYDEQRWELTSSAGELGIRIVSDSYWGFGLIARCFMNRIELTGPLGLRARCVHDIISSLGRNPWEPVWVRRFEKSTKGLITEHGVSWMDLESRAKADMNEEILELEGAVKSLRGKDEGIEGILDSASQALDEARAALSDRNAPAVERALGRATSAIVEADPSTEVRSSEQTASRAGVARGPTGPVIEDVQATELLKDDVPFVDLSEEE